MALSLQGVYVLVSFWISFSPFFFLFKRVSSHHIRCKINLCLNLSLLIAIIIFYMLEFKLRISPNHSPQEELSRGQTTWPPLVVINCSLKPCKFFYFIFIFTLVLINTYHAVAFLQFMDETISQRVEFSLQNFVTRRLHDPSTNYLYKRMIGVLDIHFRRAYFFGWLG